MHLRIAAVAILLAGSSISCSENEPPAAAPSAGGSLTAAPSGPTVAVAPVGHASSPSTIVAPPKDARYTLFCLDIDGAGHTERANQQKDLWQQATGRRDWYVIHQESDSILYFGYYRSYNDPKDARENARAQADRQMIGGLKNSIGDQPFQQAMFVSLDAPDPTAPPQWNLVNAKGFWSIEVASQNGPERKLAVVEEVRAARAQGIEAYYFHGPSVSSICIGSWPAEAIKKQEESTAQNPDSADPLMIVPGSIAGLLPSEVRGKDGSPIKVLHQQVDIVDPSMLATLRQYPKHSVNGYEDGKPSAPVQIPHPHDNPILADHPPVDLLGGGAPPVQSSQGGHLRSIGE